jgi:hypothetical protein
MLYDDAKSAVSYPDHGEQIQACTSVVSLELQGTRRLSSRSFSSAQCDWSQQV